MRDLALAGRIREASPTCRGCDYPMRSSVRMALEDLCDDGSAPRVDPTFSVVTHATELRLSRPGATLGVIVFAIDEESGLIGCAADAADPALRELGPVEEGALCLRIAHGERFSFGSLEPMWCPARIRRSGPIPNGGGDALALSVQLSPEAEEYRLLPWYAADWHIPTPRSNPSPPVGGLAATRA
jgi:hypothetical protein